MCDSPLGLRMSLLGKDKAANEQVISCVLAEYLVESNRERRLRKRCRAIAMASKVFLFGGIALMIMTTGGDEIRKYGRQAGAAHVALTPLQGASSNTSRNRYDQR